MIVNRNIELLFIDYTAEYMKTVKVLLEQGKRLSGELIHLVRTPDAGIALLREHDGVEMIVLHTAEDKKGICKTLTRLRHSSLAMIMLISQLESYNDISEFYRYGMNFFVPPIYPPEMAVAYFEAFYDRHRLIPGVSSMKEVEHIKDNAKMQCGDLMIDPAQCMVRRGDLQIKLTGQEFDLLYYLASNADRWLSADQIFAHVWHSKRTDNSSLTSRIYRLRQKIEHNPQNPVYILSMYGVGYLFRSNP